MTVDSQTNHHALVDGKVCNHCNHTEFNGHVPAATKSLYVTNFQSMWDNRAVLTTETWRQL